MNDSLVRRSDVLSRDHTVLPVTHKWNEPDLSLLFQPHSITTLWPVVGNFSVPPKWLVYVPRWYFQQKTVTHLSANRAQRRATSVIRRYVASLSISICQWRIQQRVDTV